MPVSAEDAAKCLHDAFCRTRSRRLHLCPLDQADDLPSLTFGPNRVKKFSADELKSLVDEDTLTRIRPERLFNAENFSQFTWLVVEEYIEFNEESSARVLPNPMLNVNRDFAAIVPHRERFPSAVEAALFGLLLPPWEDWVVYRDVDWRGFRIPWVYTVDDDLFTLPLPPATPETLSWEPKWVIDEYNEHIEIEGPLCLPLGEAVADASRLLDDTTWSALVCARQSPLFETPIAHFLVRAFLADGIDEFLAHITVIEAALGLSIDYRSANRPPVDGKRLGPTDRVARRLSALLEDDNAGGEYRQLFNIRSEFIHGRAMESPILSEQRILARRLARKVVVALQKAAVTLPSSVSREDWLQALLDGKAFRS